MANSEYDVTTSEKEHPPASTDVVVFDADEPVEMLIERSGAAAGAISAQNSKFIAELRQGVLPADAAAKAGVPLKNLIRRRDVLARIRDLMGYYIPESEIRRALILGAATKIALEDEDVKNQLSALNLLAKDPEVGMTASAPQVQVQVISKETSEILANVPNVPGLEDET